MIGSSSLLRSEIACTCFELPPWSHSTWVMGLCSCLYSRVWSFNLTAWFIDFTFRICNSSLKTQPWHWNSPCFTLLLLKLYACIQIYFCLHRFPSPALTLLLTLRLFLCAHETPALRFLLCSQIVCTTPLSKFPNQENARSSVDQWNEPSLIARAFALFLRSSRIGTCFLTGFTHSHHSGLY